MVASEHKQSLDGDKNFLLRKYSSRKEFLQNYTKIYSDQARLKLLFYQLIHEMILAVTENDIESFKNFCNYFAYIYDAEDHLKLASFYGDDRGSHVQLNVINQICKYGRIEFLKYMIEDDSEILKKMQTIATKTYLLTDKDSASHDALYYAVASCDIEMLSALLKFWSEKCFHAQLEELDAFLSQAYEELKLNNIVLTEEMEMFVENQLINIRLLSSHSRRVPSNNALLSFIKDSIKLLVDNVALLDSLPEVDEKFIRLGKYIVRNIHLLKEKLKSTYDKLPWEEMEFCLVGYISSCVKKQKMNVIYRATLNRRKITEYLNHFVKRLKEEEKNINLSNIKQRSILQKLNRDDNIRQVIKNDPQFEELFIDYQGIRDMYSLEKLSKYVDITSLVNPSEREGQLVIIRSLQVLGEHLKNTPESPYLSSFRSEVLLLALSDNTRRIVENLRSSMSYANSLSERIEIEQNTETIQFWDIQRDIIKMGVTIKYMIQSYTLKIAKMVFKKLIDINGAEEIEQITDIFYNFDLMWLVDNFRKKNYKTDYEKILYCFEQLKTCLTNPTPYEEDILRKLRIIMELEDKNSNTISVALMGGFSNVLNKLKYKLQQESHNEFDIKCIKVAAKELLQYFSQIRKLDPGNLKEITKLVIEIYYSCKPRVELTIFHRIARVAYDIFLISEYEIDDVKSINQFQSKLSKNMHIVERLHTKLHTKETYKNRLNSNLFELESILKHNSLDNSTGFSFLKNNKKLQTVLEILILDILTIFYIFDDKYEDDFDILNKASPSLYGKYLRKYLQHDDFLIDVLMHDPSIAIFLNAMKIPKIAKNITVSKKSMHRKSEEDDDYYKRKSEYGIAILQNKEDMFSALEECKFNLFEECIAKGADIRSRNLQLWTALHYASKGGDLRNVQYILQRIDNKLVNIDGQNALHIAAKYGRVDIVKILIENTHLNFQVNEKDDNKKSSLHAAAENGHTETTEVLLQNGAETAIRDDYKYSPLHYAVERNHIDIVKLLLKEVKSVGTNEILSSGNTPLHIAAAKGHLDLVNLLLDHGVDIHLKNENGMDALFLAVHNNHRELACTLISRGSNVNVELSKGSSLLHHAAMLGHEEIVKVLLENGADPNHRDISLNSPVHIAATHGSVKVLKTLFKYNGQAEPKNRLGQTPLFSAVEAGKFEAVTFLVEFYTEVDVSTNIRLLLAAIIVKRAGIFEFLFHHKSFSNVRGTDKNSVLLYMAAKVGHEDIVSLLIEERLDVNTKAKLIARQTETVILSLPQVNNESKTFSELPLHAAARNGNKYIIKKLLDNKAMVNAENDYGVTPLYYAAEYGNTDAVNILIEYKADVNAECKNGLRPLHAAVFNSRKDIVKILVRNGADVNAKGLAKGGTGTTPLAIACRNADEKIVKFLLANDADNAGRDDFDLTPLVVAAKCNKTDDIVKSLVNSGANVNEDDGRALYHAVESSSKRIVEFLLRNKAHPSCKPYDDASPLHLAVRNCDEDAVDLLIFYGADVDCADSKGITPLTDAIKLKQERIFQTLIANGADVNAASDDGQTALHVASSLNNINMVEVLLACNADVDARNERNETPLELAVTNDHIENVKAIIQLSKVDINGRCSQGNTLLHLATDNGNLEMVKLLVKRKADIYAKDKIGRKSIHIALEDDYEDIFEFFLEEGMSVDEKSTSNKTLLHYAVASKNNDIVEYLIKKGVDVNSKSSENSTPLHIAAQIESRDIVRLLLRNGACYDALTKSNKKPIDETRNEEVTSILAATDKLFNVVKENSLDGAEIFIKLGAIVNAKSAADNLTPLHYAIMKNYTDMVSLLLRFNSNPNISGNDGLTPLHYASKFSRTEMLKSLLAKGAIYNCVSKCEKTPPDMTDKKEIVSIFKLINETFEKVKDQDFKIIRDLERIRDVDTVRAVVGTFNKENESVVAIAIKNNCARNQVLVKMYDENLCDLVDTGNSLYRQYNFELAFEVFQSLYEKTNAILGPDHLNTIRFQELLYAVMRKQGKREECLKILGEIVRKQELILGKFHKHTLRTKSDMDVVLRELGKNGEMNKLHENIEKLQKQTMDLDGTILIRHDLNSAAVSNSDGRHDEAINLARRAYENSLEKFGAHDEKTLMAHHHVAFYLGAKGKFDEALEILKKVFEEKKTILGPGNADTLMALDHIIVMLTKKGDLDELTDAFEEKLKIRKKYIKSSRSVIQDKYNLARAYFDKKNYNRSLLLFSEILAEKEAVERDDSLNHIISESEKHSKMLMKILSEFGCDGRVSLLEDSTENLRTAVCDGDVETVKYLLENGADVDYEFKIKSNDGRLTILHISASAGNAEVTNLLLDFGANINDVDPVDGSTPLHLAVINNNIEAAQVILKYANQKQLNDYINNNIPGNHFTALHLASIKGDFEMAKLLLKYNAIYESRDIKGRTPLSLSKNSDISNLLELIDDMFRIVESGSSIDLQKQLNIISNDDLGAIMNARNYENKSMVQVAIVNKQREVANKLLSVLKNSGQD